MGPVSGLHEKPQGLHIMTHAAGFVRVEAIEMPSDDWHRDSQREHAGDGTRRANQLADVTNGHLVSVAYGCHGNNGPPERVGDAVDLRVWLTELGVVDETGENKQADEQSDEEHAETFQTGAERQQEHLESDGVLGELEEFFCELDESLVTFVSFLVSLITP